jgi:hypothetical protein
VVEQDRKCGPETGPRYCLQCVTDMNQAGNSVLEDVCIEG